MFWTDTALKFIYCKLNSHYKFYLQDLYAMFEMLTDWLLPLQYYSYFWSGSIEYSANTIRSKESLTIQILYSSVDCPCLPFKTSLSKSYLFYKFNNYSVKKIITLTFPFLCPHSFSWMFQPAFAIPLHVVRECWTIAE